MKKYLVLFLLIVGFFGYAAYQEAASAHRDMTPGRARYKSIVEHVVMLEERRLRLFRASGGGGSLGAGGPGATRVAEVQAGAGSYGRGYAMGFYQGYVTGEYLSVSRVPNPLFFKIPQPY